jgi:hypothetical protein
MRIFTLATVFALGILTGVLATGTAVSGLQRSPAAGQPDARAVEAVLAKDQIREQLYNYGRGLDRMDRPLALKAYHSDSTVGGVFTGSGAEWVDSARRTLERESASSHQMTNVIIKVDGDKAGSETYFIVSQHAGVGTGVANAPHTSLIRGRYIDRWSKRNGTWGIDHREIIVDFSTNDIPPPAPASAAAPRPSAGKRDKTDPSYAVLN